VVVAGWDCDAWLHAFTTSYTTVGTAELAAHSMTSSVVIVVCCDKPASCNTCLHRYLVWHGATLLHCLGGTGPENLASSCSGIGGWKVV
jgi:hypothetical protein